MSLAASLFSSPSANATEKRRVSGFLPSPAPGPRATSTNRFSSCAAPVEPIDRGVDARAMGDVTAAGRLIDPSEFFGNLVLPVRLEIGAAAVDQAARLQRGVREDGSALAGAAVR